MPPDETPDLFEAPEADVVLAPGARILRGFAGADGQTLLATIAEVCTAAPFRHMTTPGGWRMSVAMTNCDTAGWVTDRTGYRYDPVDPETGRPWPAMPQLFAALASRAAERAGFAGSGRTPA